MAPKCEKTYMPSILAGYLYNWMQVPRCERRTGRALLRDLVVWGVQHLDKKITMAAKSGHIYLEIFVGLVWPRVFVCPPPPSKLGAQPFPIFFHPPCLSSPLQLWRGPRGATTKKHNTAIFKKNVARVVGCGPRGPKVFISCTKNIVEA